ncbi:ATP-dependent DNA helicase RecQ-like isoform X2 [Phymastichus coffea]|uniref:ATP-dependent DNA helicase RecQ-like isoform X2 n=1 Tax=Phymastichus coffea TaxID=108790 RepID=UPI00273B0A45|nr:ATP-dependent DNA helicase RecQ-like isoform X2 [Phymastichus coffea]
MREDDILSNLNKYFGYEAFRPGQLPIILKILEKRDVIVCKEAGFGKSLCFQLPGIMREGLVVVFSSLPSRIERKCQELSSKKLNCAYLNKIMCNNQSISQDLRNVIESKNKFWDDLRSIRTSGLKFLYVTLSHFKNSTKLREVLEDIYRKNMLQAIVIDDINYTYQWLSSFKRDYSKLGLLREIYPNTAFLCFIGPTSQDKFFIVKDTLHLKNPYMLNEPSTMINLSYQVMYMDESIPTLKLIQFIKESYHGKSGIIYCFNKDDCQTLVENLKINDISSILYTCELTDKQKDWIKYRNADGIVIVCLSGLPVDLSLIKIDFTVHMRIPIALDIYIEETSKVGKYGTERNNIVLYSKTDSQYHLNLMTNPFKEKISKAIDIEIKSLLLDELRVYRQELFEVILFAENQSICRQVLVLKYLNDENVVEPCGICDVCLVMTESFVIDMSYSLKKILMAIWVINRSQNGVKSDNFIFAGITFLIDVLLGRMGESMKIFTGQLSDNWIFGLFGSWDSNILYILIIVLLIQKFASVNLVANDEFAVHQNLVITNKGKQFVETTHEFGIPFSCKDVKITKWFDINWVENQFIKDLKTIITYYYKSYNLEHDYYFHNYCIHLISMVQNTEEVTLTKLKKYKFQPDENQLHGYDRDLFISCLMYHRILTSLKNGVGNNKAT